MFSGFFDEAIIDVYSIQKGLYNNINYNIVDSYDDIDYFLSILSAKENCQDFHKNRNKWTDLSMLIKLRIREF